MIVSRSLLYELNVRIASSIYLIESLRSKDMRSDQIMSTKAARLKFGMSHLPTRRVSRCLKTSHFVFQEGAR